MEKLVKLIWEIGGEVEFNLSRETWVVKYKGVEIGYLKPNVKDKIFFFRDVVDRKEPVFLEFVTNCFMKLKSSELVLINEPYIKLIIDI